ncbi:MAG: Ig-like domain-containing protein [Polyangiaceae bacterium]
MRRLLLLVPFAGFAAFAGCGGGDDHSPYVPMTGAGGVTGNLGGTTSKAGAGGTAGTSTSGGKASTGGNGTTAEGGAGGEASLAPSVEITSPPQVLDPNDGTQLLTGSDADSIKVTCKVAASAEAGAAAVNTSSVLITATSTAVVGAKPVQAAGSGSAGTYTATLVVSELPHGPLTFTCSASDKNTPPRTGSDQISTFIDRGPVITPVEPAANTAHPLGITHFEFTVAAAPLPEGATDPGSAVTDVTLSTNGVPITTLAADKKRPGYYTAEVDFTDRTLFGVTPTGSIPVTITATNSRMPIAAVASSDYTFVLDGTGPIITITSPVPNAVIGGPKRTSLIFTVKDDGSGVQPTSVVVKLNNTSYRYSASDPDWIAKDGTYTFTFDNTKFSGSVAQLTVNVQADDKAGNSAVADSLFLRLDNQSPIVSLDPPAARILYMGDNGSKLYCSAPFDPLGEAVDDADVKNPTPLNALFRAFIWERTNGSPSSDIKWVAGVNADTPHLYLQPDASKGILIDTDADGMCDSINPDVKALTSLQLLPVTPAGAGDTNAANLNPTAEPSVSSLACNSTSVDLKYMCTEQLSDMKFVAAQHLIGQNVAAVWAPGAVDEKTCTGTKWELGPDIAPQEGWLCLAASAEDKVGNAAVSRPLRVCFDSELTPEHPACATSSTTPPTCTTNCTPPDLNIEGYGIDQPFLIRY